LRGNPQALALHCLNSIEGLKTHYATWSRTILAFGLVCAGPRLPLSPTTPGNLPIARFDDGYRWIFNASQFKARPAFDQHDIHRLRRGHGVSPQRSRPCAPSGCCPTDSPTANSAPTSRRSLAGAMRT
jgi:hypothetical protein